MRILLLLLILSGSNCCTAQDVQQFRLLTYGLPDFETQDARKIVAGRWEIEFYPVAGCMVYDALIDSVRLHNAAENKKIEAVYGIGWRDKFEKQVKAEFAIHQQITAILDQQGFIKNKNTELAKTSSSLYYKIKPLADKNIYEVLMYAVGEWEGKPGYITHFILQVDYKEKLVSILSDKATVHHSNAGY